MGINDYKTKIFLWSRRKSNLNLNFYLFGIARLLYNNKITKAKSENVHDRLWLPCLTTSSVERRWSSFILPSISTSYTNLGHIGLHLIIRSIMSNNFPSGKRPSTPQFFLLADLHNYNVPEVLHYYLKLVQDHRANIIFSAVKAT